MDSLDIKSALDVVEKLDRLELEKPIFGNRPIMHHILNLYFLRKNIKDRDGLVYLMHKLISLGINVNKKFQNDPDIMFKALFIREMSLSKEIASAGMISKEVATLTQLYTVPCDPVPLSKLLLHAQSVMEKQRRELNRSLNLEEMSEAFDSVRLGVDSKAAIKPDDMYFLSPSFQQLMEILRQEKIDIHLPLIFNILNEIASDIHKILLHNIVLDGESASEGLLRLANILNTKDTKGRNLYHLLAYSNSVLMVKDITNVLFHQFSQFITQDEMEHLQYIVREGLIQRVSVSGHTPLAFSTVRYGKGGDIHTSFMELYQLANVFMHVTSKADHFIEAAHALPYAEESLGLQQQDGSCVVSSSSAEVHDSNSNSNSVHTDDDKNVHSISLVSTVINSNQQCDTASNRKERSRGLLPLRIPQVSDCGGWSTERLQDDRIPHIEQSYENSKCDVIEVWPDDTTGYSSLPTSQDFFINYLNNGIPVIFRNALIGQDNQHSSYGNNVQAVLKRNNFLRKYGNYSIPIADIPYAKTFGKSSSYATFQEVCAVLLHVTICTVVVS